MYLISYFRQHRTVSIAQVSNIWMIESDVRQAEDGGEFGSMLTILKKKYFIPPTFFKPAVPLNVKHIAASTSTEAKQPNDCWVRLQQTLMTPSSGTNYRNEGKVLQESLLSSTKITASQLTSIVVFNWEKEATCCGTLLGSLNPASRSDLGNECQVHQRRSHILEFVKVRLSQAETAQLIGGFPTRLQMFLLSGRCGCAPRSNRDLLPSSKLPRYAFSFDYKWCWALSTQAENKYICLT